jgi:ubiquinone/menaquinone biosynthesis C-methylase UbiE
MLRLAQRKLRRSQHNVALIRGRAESLPFSSETFDAIVVAFPTAFVYDQAWLRSAARVLRPRGRLIVVEVASATGKRATDRCIEGLYRAAGLTGTGPDLLERAGSTGLTAWQETVALESSTVYLVIAEKPIAQQPARGTARTGI